MKLLQGRGRKAEWNKILQDLVLPLDEPRTPELLLREYVRQVRGNRLMLTRDPRVASPGGPSGMWVPSTGVDLVWAHPAAEGVLLWRILGHEMGHMANGDEPDPIDLPQLMKLLQSMCSHTSEELWAASMCRTNFSDPRERTAEEFSYFTEDWLLRTRPATSDIVTNMRECLETRNEYW
ncbi:hypothetical protein ABZS76_33120 [Streptomyces sp. NPDC005562]|uniref:hypothetical protein n=1 Tax=Streptomyces sp. NPDC005562 TaxID=3154890 RepID=UPI0033A7FEC4